MPRPHHAALLALLTLPGLPAHAGSAETGTQAREGARSIDVKARLRDADDLLRAGLFDRATDEYVWLWDHMVEHRPSMRGVRVSFMAASMRQLASVHAPAREAFVALRDRAALTTNDRTRNDQARADWLVLNIRVLDDDTAVARWIDDPGTKVESIEDHRHIILDWLIMHDRWTLAGEILPSAQRLVQRHRDMYTRMAQADGDNPELAALAAQQRRENFSEAHAAYLAAGRPESAWFVADSLLEDVPGEDTIRSICKTAIRAGVVEQRHLDLAKGNDYLIGQLREALNANAG